MKSILLVLHGYPFESMGGVGLLLRDTVRALAEDNWNVHVLAPRQSIRNQLHTHSEEWGTVHLLDCRTMRWKDSWNNTRSTRILRQFFHQHSFSHCHIHHLSGLPLELSDCIPSSTTLILSLHDFALPCARGQLYHRDHFMCSGPSLSKCYQCLQPIRPSLNGIEQRNELVLKLLDRCDRIVAPSQAIRSQFHSFYPNRCIDIIQLPLLHEDYTVKAPKEICDFIFAGSIIPSKGLDILLQAYAKLKTPRPSLKILGFTPPFPTWNNYVEQCKQMASIYPNISWLGSCSHEETIREMSGCRTLVLPSVWPENSPLSIREASKLGLNIICPSWGGSSELATDALLWKSRSVWELAERMKESLSLQTTQRTHWISATEYIQTLYS